MTIWLSYHFHLKYFTRKFKRAYNKNNIKKKLNLMLSFTKLNIVILSINLKF